MHFLSSCLLHNVLLLHAQFIFKDGSYNDVDILVDINSNEGGIFFSETYKTEEFFVVHELPDQIFRGNTSVYTEC